MSYTFGKTPLRVRIQRYLVAFDYKGYIPIHPGEYYDMWEKQPRVMTALTAEFGPLLPLGGGK